MIVYGERESQRRRWPSGGASGDQSTESRREALVGELRGAASAAVSRGGCYLRLQAGASFLTSGPRALGGSTRRSG